MAELQPSPVSTKCERYPAYHKRFYEKAGQAGFYCGRSSMAELQPSKLVT